MKQTPLRMTTPVDVGPCGTAARPNIGTSLRTCLACAEKVFRKAATSSCILPIYLLRGYLFLTYY